MSALLALGGVVQGVPADAAPLTFSGWTHREDARPPATDATWTRAEPHATIDEDGRVVVSADAADGGPTSIAFIPPSGTTLSVGSTYEIGGLLERPTGAVGQVVAYRDGTLCGRPRGEVYGVSWLAEHPMRGWFRIDRLDVSGSAVTSFAATYEISCQYVDGPAGYEGSVAVSSPSPQAMVPPAPATPGPVTDLMAVNTTPEDRAITRTTLAWTNPADYHDITVEIDEVAEAANVTPAVGRWSIMWRGDATTHVEDYIDGIETRTYRVMAHGPTGRLGTPAHVTVVGSRISGYRSSQTIQLGQTVTFDGRLTQALGEDQFGTYDRMNGPVLAGRRIVLAESPPSNDGWKGVTVDSVRTDENGRFSLSAEPVANRFYELEVPAAPGLLANATEMFWTFVAPQTDLRLPLGDVLRARGTASYREVRKGTTVRFTTSRARRGSLGFLRLQRRLADGSWRTILRKDLGRGTDRLRLPYRASTRGLHVFRVVKPGDRSHVNGRSHLIRLRVR